MDTERNVGGRPSKRTPEVEKAICDAIRRGHYMEHAAPLAGVSKATVYSWLQSAEAGDPEYAGFLDAVRSAEAEAVDRALSDIENAAGGKDAAPWTNRAWWLERRHTRLFGRTVTEIEHSGTVGVVKVELPDMPEGASPEERRRLLREIVGR
jgi:transposase